MLTYELRQIAGKAAGTYFVVSDNSPQQNIETFTNLRVAFIAAQTGPTNQLLVFEQGDKAGFEALFGKSIRKQTKLGNYSIDACLKMIEDGQLGVINLRKYDETDVVEISSENLLIDTKDSNITVPYGSIVNENGFWVVKVKNLTEAFVSATSKNKVLNFSNINEKDKSYFVVKASDADVESLTSEGNETLLNTEIEFDDFPALNPSTLLKDTFVSVYIFNNNFVDASTNKYYGDLFLNKSGVVALNASDLDKLSAIKQSGFATKITGTLIPNVTSEFGNQISFDLMVNSVSASTGVYCKINTEVFETETDIFDSNNISYLSNLVYGEFETEFNNDNIDFTLKYAETEAYDVLSKLSYVATPLIGMELAGSLPTDASYTASTDLVENVGPFNVLEYGSDNSQFSKILANLPQTTVEDIVYNSVIKNIHSASVLTNKNSLNLINVNSLIGEDEALTISTSSVNKLIHNDNTYVVAGKDSALETVVIGENLSINKIVKNSLKITEQNMPAIFGDDATTSAIATAILNDFVTNSVSIGVSAIQTNFDSKLELSMNTLNGLLPKILIPGLSSFARAEDSDLDNYLTANSVNYNFQELAQKLNAVNSDDAFIQINAYVTYEGSAEVTTFLNKFRFDYVDAILGDKTFEISDASNQELLINSADAVMSTLKLEVVFKSLMGKADLIGELTFASSGVLGAKIIDAPTSEVLILDARNQQYLSATAKEYNIDVIGYDFTAIEEKGLVTVADHNTKYNKNAELFLGVLNKSVSPMSFVTATNLSGFKLKDSQLYNGTLERQNEILDVMNDPSIIQGLKNAYGVRYFVDVFKSFIEPAYKVQYNRLVSTLDESKVFTRAIVNEPFISDLSKSINPSFKDAVGDTRTLKLAKYLPTGGNIDVSTKFLSKPTIAPEMVYYFGSEETDGYNETPIAHIVSELFISKDKPWSIVANSTGILNGISNLALDPDEEERRAMENFGWNPIIKKRNNNQFVVYGDFTGNNAFKKRKALSFISNSELLVYIKNELLNMSLDEGFKKGTYEDYVRFETEVNTFMEDLALQSAIKPNPIVKCDFENNTADVQNAGIKLVTVEYYNFQTLDKVVFSLNLQ